jgi:uncharacterized membrane protein YGL010W
MGAAPTEDWVNRDKRAKLNAGLTTTGIVIFVVVFVWALATFKIVAEVLLGVGSMVVVCGFVKLIYDGAYDAFKPR